MIELRDRAVYMTISGRAKKWNIYAFLFVEDPYDLCAPPCCGYEFGDCPGTCLYPGIHYVKAGQPTTKQMEKQNENQK
jgi:hypothetical protein